MSELAIRRTGESPFRPATMALVLAVGILAFVGLLLLGAYAPDLRSGGNGGPHALSNSATGLSGIVRLAEATGRNPVVVRNRGGLATANLLVVTPETGGTNLTPVLEGREGKPTLIVMPKWQTVPDKKSGWVRSRGWRPAFETALILAPDIKVDVRLRKARGAELTPSARDAPAQLRFVAPAALQTISGKDLRPILTGPGGSIVVAQVGTQPLYLLADPDLLSNMGLGDIRNAAAALSLLDHLNRAGAKQVSFDVTLNGLGHSLSPLRLAFDPPFVTATLALALCLLLAGVQSLYRFGSPRPPQREIAFGKAALIDNSAAFVRRARRESRFGGRYAEVVRDRAIALFKVPPRLKEAEADRYLDGIGKGARFTELAESARNARDENDLLAATRALNLWLKENIR